MLELKSTAFASPVKKINSERDVVTFHESIAYARIIAFIRLLNEALPGRRLTEPELQSQASEPILGLLQVLDILDRYIDECPPKSGPRRFGNVAFRTWTKQLEDNADLLLREHLPESAQTAMPELLPYFTGSFGSGQRLDYGTGHELSFAAFLCGLYLLGVLTPGQDDVALVLLVLNRYFGVVRRLIRTYTLEPAGSHGVWGLDDHSFLPYIFGSAQLKDIEGTPPTASVTDRTLVERYREDNLYFGAIGFINDVKKGPFYEHSSMLYDISGVQLWTKINQGMLKMYNAEVLSKFPVVQHFPFGPVLFPFETTAERGERPEQTGVATGLSASTDATVAPGCVTSAPWAASANNNATSMRPGVPPATSRGSTQGGQPPSSMPPPDMGPTRAPWAKS
ncbi:Serine/threonine-protein phosphatase 2A activator 1 [Saitoella coloradoensis]